MSDVKKFGPYDCIQVLNYLPHRNPFLFVDRILEVTVPMKDGKMEPIGVKVVGLKNATVNEPYFAGHFPGLPITPGVVILETMAQICSFGVMPWVKTDDTLKVLSSFSLRLAGVDNARFRKPLVPGDTLTVKGEVTKHRGPIWAFHCTGEVDGHLIAEADILASVTLGD